MHYRYDWQYQARETINRAYDAYAQMMASRNRYGMML
jgi:hypothetical protein